MLLVTQDGSKLINMAGISELIATEDGYVLAMGFDGCRLATCGKYGSAEEAREVLKRVCQVAGDEEETSYRLPAPGVTYF